MAAPAIEIDGHKFTKALARRLVDLEHEAERDVVRLAADIRQDLQARVPIDTGKTKRSIRVSIRKNARGLLATVRVGTFYAKFVEYGTSERPARPFFRPAVHQSIAAFRRHK